MNTKVKEWLDAQNAELNSKKSEMDAKESAEKQAKREQILIEAGLYTDGNKEYFDPDKHSIKELSFFTESEIVNGEKRFYRYGLRKAIEVTDEEFSAICDMLEKKHRFESAQSKVEESKPKAIEEHVETKNAPEYYYELDRDTRIYQTSNIARCIQIMAILIWIGGIILSIFGSFELTIDRWGDYEKKFNVLLFIQNLVTYILIGLGTWWSSEVFENIQSIVNELRGLRLVRKKEN